MSALHRHHVVNLFDDINHFDGLLKGLLTRPAARSAQTETRAMHVDVLENDSAYTLHADLPGVKKEDIDVQVEGNVVVLSATVKNERETKDGEKLLRSERYTGRLARSFQLASEVNEAEAVARFTDGVLELTLPKRVVNDSRRRLTIQ